MNKSSHAIYLLVVIVLVALLILQFNRGEKVEFVEKRVTDTLTIIKHDTIVQYRPSYVAKRIVDTIYVYNDKDTIFIEQKHYSKSGLYDAWISGYNTTIDSIYVYPKNTYSTITKETIKYVDVRRWDTYAYLGFKRLSNAWTPSIGLIAKSPKKWVYGFDLGLYDNNRISIGFNVGYKID